MDFSLLEQRLLLIEKRLGQIETILHLPVSEEISEETRVSERRTKEPARAPKQGNWLGLVATLCFILAAGFIIKLSIESGWLTPERQIGLAFLFGALLIGSGFVFIAIDKYYASLLPAAGIIVLYLSNFAAHRLYFLISFETAIVLTSLISVLCITLYLKFRHDIYSIIAAIGSYLAPVVLNINANTLFSLYYFLICSLTYATISIWVESRILIVVAAYLSILVTGLIGLGLQMDSTIAIFLALHFLVFAIGTYLYSKYGAEPLTEKESWAFFPVLLIFYSMEYFYIDRAYPGLAPWVSIGFAAILCSLYLSARQWFPDRAISSRALVLAFSTIVFFHSFYLELLPDAFKPWLFVVIIVGIAFLPVRLLGEQRDGAFYLPSLAVFLILVIEYCSMLMHLLNNSTYSWVLVSFASFASLWLLITRHRSSLIQKKEYGLTLLLAAHLLGVSALYQFFHEISSLAVSASWLLYAVCVIGYAYFRQDKTMAKSALLILSVAAGKALLYDTASTPTVVRILCLILTGAVLYGCGLLMKRIASWQDN
ncbi:hypothetical protein Lqui_2929 [Legionella quinlivanii]|uniref:DUF2339 domain-containing protein n=1 Tax=Legionella quinlivanii TaxID=45073 RepID=A0A0W0XM65_9GAMM|nr:DUF2339 domain-containing protein [Legionella quinlivanii]KTD45458.1 hypothetical protein Lqui_2929 [Legionella quinlivanii]MCW8451254.1 DUF2339 domain-containing protein [Legionella quinlivanii]SEG33176.1 Predicted membrane protein [Legionella quinlivanii DSM 21216]STY10549.1 Predicted membrane protein [Legionella quinlivanii]